MVDNERVKIFLIDAKKNTYASGTGILIDSLKPGSKDLPYKEGEFSYMDSYFGDLNFIGQEIVWYKEKPIWGMNYYGNTYDPIDGFPKFLFECLKHVTTQAPYRGPEQFQDDKFEYNCSWQGDINNVKGEELIKYDNKVIYQLSFHGGVIKYM